MVPVQPKYCFAKNEMHIKLPVSKKKKKFVLIKVSMVGLILCVP